MGVCRCDRFGCDNIMCDRHGPGGMLCEECFDELVELGVRLGACNVDIQAFMSRGRQNESVEGDYEDVREYFDEIFVYREPG